MTGVSFTLFDTAIGRCALAWGAGGIAFVQLPEAGEAETRRRVLARCSEAQEAEPPLDVARARDGIIALLAGEATDLSSLPLDLDKVPAFHRRVYEAARAIAPGTTSTYGALAQSIGAERAARAVGQALGRNPFPILVPCHRVLAASGELGGFSAHGGIGTKRRLLEIEGVELGALGLVGRLEARPSSRRHRPKGEGTAGLHASR